MLHVREAAAPAESRLAIGSPGTMHCKKAVPNTTHFRTIAPKVTPKIVSSFSSSGFPPSLSDVAVPAVKPLVINPQKYTLMKVAGHDGTFSLVALPQVTSAMGSSVIKNTGIPLQKNLKLPIPRYQPARSKKFLNKKMKGACKPKTAGANMQVNEDGPSEATTKLEPKTENAKPLRAAEESGLESRLFTTSGVEVCEVNNSNIPCTESSLNPSSATRSPIKLIEKRISSSNGSGSSVRYESAKVVDSTNSLTVLSPVVFGSPLQPLQSVPKGKLPILPYSKMKKSVASEAIKAKPSIGPTSVQTTPCEVQITSPSVNVLNFSALDSPRQPNLTSDPGIHINQNYSFARKRGKKRKTYSEILGYQTKIRLVGKKIITCKDKYKAQAEVAGKSETASKKYRNIMPKPMGEVQSLASLSASNPLLHASTAECHLRNRFGSRLHRWRQGDHSLTPKSSTKVLYKCHVCDHSFQFKHHLQDHLNGHSNRRPYHCRLCRKAYVHSGSLSTHMKLHHSESRLKKLMCCEFCAKVFGHIRVYIGHLKEVHRVAISTESSCKLGKKSLTLKARPETSLLLQRNKSVSTEGDSVPRPNDGVQLQIRCGRCPFVATAFSAMKLHLFSVHEDESQEVLPEGVLQCGRGAQEEVVEEATHQWKLLDESRNGAEGCGCLVSTMKEPLVTPSADGEHPPGLSSQIKFFCRDHFNCLLCAEAYKSRQEVFRHWEEQHNCENPTLLWALFSSLPQNEQKNT